MEIEEKKSRGKVEKIRHWKDAEIKEFHKANGKTWRSNKTKLTVIPVTQTFRDNYSSIFNHE